MNTGFIDWLKIFLQAQWDWFDKTDTSDMGEGPEKSSIRNKEKEMVDAISPPP